MEFITYILAGCVLLVVGYIARREYIYQKELKERIEGIKKGKATGWGEKL